MKVNRNSSKLKFRLLRFTACDCSSGTYCGACNSCMYYNLQVLVGLIYRVFQKKTAQSLIHHRVIESWSHAVFTQNVQQLIGNTEKDTLGIILCLAIGKWTTQKQQHRRHFQEKFVTEIKFADIRELIETMLSVSTPRQRRSYNGTYTRPTERCNFVWSWITWQFSTTRSIARPLCDSFTFCKYRICRGSVRARSESGVALLPLTWCWARPVSDSLIFVFFFTFSAPTMENMTFTFFGQNDVAL